MEQMPLIADLPEYPVEPSDNPVVDLKTQQELQILQLQKNIADLEAEVSRLRNEIHILRQKLKLDGE